MQTANLTYGGDGRIVMTLFSDDGSTTIINESHPNFLRIKEAVENGEDFTRWTRPATQWFADQLDEYRYDEDGFDIDGWNAEGYNAWGDHRDDIEDEFDEDGYNDDGIHRDDMEGGFYNNATPVIESLSQTIERYRRDERDATNLVRFMARLAKNPSFRSREQLWSWSVAKDLTVDPDGYIIGYKGVGADLLSINSGTAFVNGVEVTGRIPNEIGSIISMPRSEVQDDPTIGCHKGLHVGTFSYAKSWGNKVVEVRIDPADVVSVPKDSGFAKMRCCEYEVLSVHEKDGDLSHNEPEAQWSQDEALEALATQAPKGWLANIKARLSRKEK